MAEIQNLAGPLSTEEILASLEHFAKQDFGPPSYVGRSYSHGEVAVEWDGFSFSYFIYGSDLDRVNGEPYNRLDALHVLSLYKDR
jgi:hypothetical protein